jgi:hypothetical protein
VASSGQKLHIIVTCTERKTAEVPKRLHLRDVPDGEPWERASNWVERLTVEVTTPALPGSDLYAGEHWTRAKALPGLAVDIQAQLWTCSAGYGLIPAAGAAAWWEAIASWEGPEPGQPRTFRELAKSDSDATFLLVLSATYLQACRADIEAARAVTDSDRFMIVSAGTRESQPLGASLLPASARLQAHLGGTRQVLNVRIAEELLKGQLTSRSAATEYLKNLLKYSPHTAQYDREKFSDDADVVDWIREEYKRGRGASASRMLRALRDSGRACEQKRFGRLHMQYLGERDRERIGCES